MYTVKHQAQYKMLKYNAIHIYTYFPLCTLYIFMLTIDIYHVNNPFNPAIK